MTKQPCFVDGPWRLVTLLVVFEVACFSYHYTSQTRTPWQYCLWFCRTHLVESSGIPSWFRSFSSAVFGGIVLELSPSIYSAFLKSLSVSSLWKVRTKKKNTFVLILNVWFRHPQLNTSQENPICLHLPVEHDVNLRCRRLRLQTAKPALIIMRACRQVSGLPLLTLRCAVCIAVVGVVMLGGTEGETRVVSPTTRAVIIPIHKVWTSRKTLIMSSPLWGRARGQFSEIAARNYAVLWGCGIAVGAGNAKESGGGRGAH